MRKDLDLVRIVSYLFFDGHLYKDLKCFFLSSKNISDLKNFEKLIKRKFGIQGRYYYNDGGAGKTKTHKYRVFSRKFCKELELLGVPKGSKTTNKYLIPKWIVNNKKFSRDFLRIAYLCEGSMKEKRKNPRISINLHKSEQLLENGLSFMNQLKSILKDEGIETTPIGVYPAKPRRDGIKVKMLRFRVLTKYNNKFIKEVGWLK
jgi:intein/homing endonuclease